MQRDTPRPSPVKQAPRVRFTETCDGYAHRLRAIGHLHEAEDESQEFVDLHAAIRAARKAYQTDGTMPDWQLIESLINEASQAE